MSEESENKPSFGTLSELKGRKRKNGGYNPPKNKDPRCVSLNSPAAITPVEPLQEPVPPSLAAKPVNLPELSGEALQKDYLAARYLAHRIGYREEHGFIEFGERIQLLREVLREQAASWNESQVEPLVAKGESQEVYVLSRAFHDEDRKQLLRDKVDVKYKEWQKLKLKVTKQKDDRMLSAGDESPEPQGVDAKKLVGNRKPRAEVEIS